MFTWEMDRPIAVFDIEATGVNPRFDRIVELAAIRIEPDGSRSTHVFRVNPGVKMNDEVIAIHGITNEDVVDCPRFHDIARDVLVAFDGCDLGGFNIIGFDIPMLMEECQRASLRFSIDDRRVFDAQRVFHKREPRDLSAALRFYCGKDHSGAHDALADADATLNVMLGQLKMYDGMPENMDDMDRYCFQRQANWADRTGKLRWISGELAISFGKNDGKLVRDLVANDPKYLRWILKGDFPRDTREMIGNALEGVFPAPPE